MTDAAPAPATPSKRQRILTTLAVVFVLAGLGWWVLNHFVWDLREHTDDAYVAGHQVAIASQVPGTVVEVTVVNTALVEPGQVLVRLDPVDAQTALARAEAQLAQAVRQVRQQRELAQHYDASTEQRRLELARLQSDLRQRQPLLAGQAIAAEEVRHLQDAVRQAEVAVQQAQRQAAAAHALVDGSGVGDNPLVLEASARYRDAHVAARRNAILAPVRGYVAQRTVQLGQRIMPGQALMSIIPLDDLWIDANFKENQLRNLRIGQPVDIRSDLYGSAVRYHGKVTGLLPGTGGAFALLPAQNASGNWIKVVQRIPVKVSLDPQELAQRPLRIGLSMTVEVDTHDRSGDVLAQAPVTTTRERTEVYAADLQQASAAAAAIVARHGGAAR